jgi:hypothetical protein
MRARQPWGEPLRPDTPVVDVAGGDTAVAAGAVAHPDAVLRIAPSPESDLARALGLRSGGEAGGDTVVACDLLDLGEGVVAVNAVVLGVAPDRLRRWHRLRPVTVEVDGRLLAEIPATTVVVANGQFLRGTDLVPRGHPGDGRLEVQVYALRPGERRGMRSRLSGGDHVPHPRILQASGRRIDVRWGEGEQPVEVDGIPLAPSGGMGIQVDPGAVRVLV